MNLKKTIFGLAIGVAMAFGGTASAADWAPDGPLKFQIGFGAGGSTDTLGRVIAKVMKEQTGWNIIVENKTGGGGVAMFTGISQAKPDGQVIGMGVSTPILINLILRGDTLPFDVDSFDYIGTVTRPKLAMIAPASAPFDDLGSMIEYSKTDGPVTIGFGAKTQQSLLKAVAKQSGANFQFVSTSGGAESRKLMLGGQLMAGFGSGPHVEYLESGDLKMIAAASSDRHSYAPDVKTIKEQGYDLSLDPYFYIATTKGTDPEALKALSTALSNALATEEAAEIIANATKTTVENLNPEETRQMMHDGLIAVEKIIAE